MKNRFELRKSRYTPVVVSHDDWLWPETLVASEVSPRGLFVSSDHLLPLGEAVRVCFRLGNPDYWDFHARIVHLACRRRQSDWGFSGVGLELLDAGPVERMQMRNLLRRYPPPSPWNVVRPGERPVDDGPAEPAAAAPMTLGDKGPIGSAAGWRDRIPHPKGRLRWT